MTYGMTDEHTPTPAAASSSTGWPTTRRAPPSPAGVTTTAAMSIEAASRSIPTGAITPVWPALPARRVAALGLAFWGVAVRGVAIRCPRIT